MNVVAICGSLSEKSANLDLLRRARDIAPAQVTLYEGLGALPHFVPDLAQQSVAEVEAFRRLLDACDGVLIASPEYGHSLPGSLKNGIDWVIGSGELYRKPVAITAAVRHPERGRRGLDALGVVLRAVDARIVWDEAIVVDDADRQLPILLAELGAAAGRSD